MLTEPLIEFLKSIQKTGDEIIRYQNLYALFPVKNRNICSNNLCLLTLSVQRELRSGGQSHASSTELILNASTQGDIERKH